MTDQEKWKHHQNIEEINRNTKDEQDGRLHISRESKYARHTRHHLISDNAISLITKNKHSSNFNDGKCFFILSSTPVTSNLAPIVTTPNALSSTSFNQRNGVFSTTIVRSTDNLSTAIARSIDNPCMVHSIYNPEINTVQSSSVTCPKLRYSLPYHSYETFHGSTYTKVHIPKETSLSSGVASVASSELSDDLHTQDIDEIIHDDRHITNMNLMSPKTVNSVKNIGNCVFIEESKEFRTQATQTEHKISCPCPCTNKIQVEDKQTHAEKITELRINPDLLDTSSESNRRDSGFSSISGASCRTPVSPQSMEFSLNSIDEEDVENLIGKPRVSEVICKPKVKTTVDENNNFNSIDVILQSKSHSLKHQYNEAKERFLQSIKQTTFDPRKELYLLELKKRLLKSKIETLDTDITTKEWEPILPTKLTPRSVLKRNFVQAIGQTLERPIKYIPMNTKILAETITQVKHCLEIIQQNTKTQQMNPSLHKNFQIHRKIKLKAYPVKYDKKPETSQTYRGILHNKTRSTLQNQETDAVDETNCFPCSRKSKKEPKENAVKKKLSNNELHIDMESNIHASSLTGNIKNILELLQQQSIDVNKKDKAGNPPIHYALKNKHYRTAILLLEAGTNIKDYTQQKVGEYKKAKEIIKRNNIQILS